MNLPDQSELAALIAILGVELAALPVPVPAWKPHGESTPDDDLYHALRDQIYVLSQLRGMLQICKSRALVLADAREAVEFETDPKTPDYWYAETERLNTAYNRTWQDGYSRAPMSEEQRADREQLDHAYGMYRRWKTADHTAAVSGALDNVSDYDN